MNDLLVTLTVLEIVLVVAALAVYLVKIARSLRASARNLANVGFGVRAIETHAAVVEPGVLRINAHLERVAASLAAVADAAEGRGTGPGAGGRPR